MADLRAKLGSSPDGLTQAEAKKRLTQYGPNEIEEIKTNEILKFLSYFWGPIPWMIEAAVDSVGRGTALAGFRHHPASASGQCCCRILGGTPGGQRDRRLEGHAGDKSPGET